jgi:hypothetical protein
MGSQILDCFERVDDEVPVTEEEAAVLLADAGIDPKASLTRLFQRIDSDHSAEIRELQIRAMRRVGRLARRQGKPNVATMDERFNRYMEFTEMTINDPNFGAVAGAWLAGWESENELSKETR